MNKIVVIGSCAIDVTVISDKRPLAGETVVGKELHMSPGGKGANQAVAAARLGADVHMVGAIGADSYGSMIQDNFRREKVHIDHVQVLDHLSSGTAHITLAEGDNSIIVLLGANGTVDDGVVDEAIEAIRQADLVMIQNEIPVETIDYISRLCVEEGVPFLLNPAPALPLAPAILDRATYITPNEHELELLFPGKNREELCMAYPEKLIVTLGKEGVIYSNGAEVVTVDAFSVEPVDTTGAGDTFNGAFATAIVNGATVEEAMRFGNGAAALSILKLGAQQGMPTKEEVEAFLKGER